jgi:hypothetical protein
MRSSLVTVGRRIEQVARQRLPQRRVLCVVGTRDQIDWQRVADLESAGAEVVIVATGVPRNPDGPRAGITEHEMEPQP